jgi:hypothetical protein
LSALYCCTIKKLIIKIRTKSPIEKHLQLYSLELNPQEYENNYAKTNITGKKGD